MFRNYLKTAFRSLARQRGYSLINILGLSVGLTVSLLILHWAQDEVQVDAFHADGDRIYRMLANVSTGTGLDTWENTPYPLIEELATHFPEVDAVGAYDPTNQKQFVVDGRDLLADGIYADDGFFQVLSFPFVEGKRRDIFREPGSLVISESLAERLFGSDWRGQVLGENLSINGEPEYRVTGVFADVPKQSSLQFDFVLNLDELHPDNPNNWPWGTYDSKVVCKLKEGVSPAVFSKKIEDIIVKKNTHGSDTKLIAQRFEEAYLHGQFENGAVAGGRIEYVRLFVMAALFLLLIACVNFMNLATARASKRAKEVGVRKTVGAGRGSLVTQFMVEAMVITLASVGVAILLGELLLPYFQELSGKELTFDYAHPAFWFITFGVGLFTALLSGSYPAFFLSAFRITNVLKGKLSYNFGGNNLRRGLVVLQFALSALLVVSALVVQRQVGYIRSKHLGLDKENVFYFRTPPGAKKQLETFKNELSQVPGVEEITFVNNNPLAVGTQTGDPQWTGMSPGDDLLFKILIGDHNILKTMRIELATGRDFSAEMPTDSMVFLVNESAARAMKLDEPIGKRLKFWGTDGPIIGVVKDFHISSLYESIGPLIIGNVPSFTNLTMMRIDPNRTEEIIAASQNIFGKFAEGHPFRYDFLDDRFLQQYRSEQRTGKLSRWFALVALSISCLGLLGLSAFIAEQKTKEIGIRKVLGASVGNLVTLLSKDFLSLVGLSLLIALPLGWYLMEGWLQDFAYRIDLSWWIFAVAGGVAIFVALATVSFQSLKAALANPVKALRSE